MNGSINQLVDPSAAGAQAPMPGTAGPVRRGRLTTAAVVVGLVVLTVAMNQPGRAAGAARNSDDPPSRIVTRSERERTRSFAIREIVAEAAPMRTAVAPARTVRHRLERGKPLVFAGIAPKAVRAGSGRGVSLTVAQNGYWSGAFGVNPNRQIGKLYFDIQPGAGEVWRHCSATAINSESKSLVVTAGHCLYNPDPDENKVIAGNGYWHEHVQFCPGYEFGCKLGVWYARERITTPTWFYGSGNPARYDWQDDVGFVVVSPNPTKGKLVDAVGGHGIAFNQPVGLYRHSFGYPLTDSRWSEYQYNGEDLVYCGSTDGYDGAGHLVISCTVTGGASGGPWIINPNAAWMGVVNSVNSHKSSGPTEGGPYFGPAEASVFQYARAR